MGIVEQYLLQLKTERRRFRRAAVILTALSLLVASCVSWNLRMTGVTLANDACCGYAEHRHTEECLVQSLICGFYESEPLPEETGVSDTEPAAEPDEAEEPVPEESADPAPDGNPEEVSPHIHTDECWQSEYSCGHEEHLHSLACYSNPEADVETPLDWQKIFEDYPFTGNLREDLVGVAKTQVGYTESTLNFEADDDEVRRGYTRYGAWYGAPYSEWSAMFVSFCLHYAGADPEEFPINSGANTMAGLWDAQGRYMKAGEYSPAAGDLVFFNDNTAGIAAEVQTAAVYVIGGDVDDAVSGLLMPLNDQSIAGWGRTDTSLPEEEQTDEEPADTDSGEEASQGVLPVVPEAPALKGSLMQSLLQSTENASDTTLETTSEIKNLTAYLSANQGSFFYTLLDSNNKELPRNDEGHFVVVANERYKLTLTVNSPKGFAPGTYQYQIPNGMMIDGDAGEFVLDDGTDIGSWEVTDTGLITFVFNEEANKHSGVVISSTLGIHFPEQEEPIRFDGNIIIKVEPPVPKEDPTQLSKWTNPGENTDKLVWHVNIFGRSDSQIPGSILTDQILLPDWYKPHSYTQSDMDAGISFGVSDPNGGWHSWTVRTGDPHLIWDESTWSYKIPQTVVCDSCGELELGSEGWEYYISYTSTPDPLNTPGTFSYANKVTIDGQTAWGWNEFTHSQVDAVIHKEGSFTSDAAGGGFLWEIQAQIPGRLEGERAEYAWFISDETRLLNENGVAIGRAQNDMHLATVTATYNGKVIRIPRVQEATDQDLFAWDNPWTATENGVSYNRTINLLCRCQCTPESCHWSSCGDYWFQQDDGTWASNGFCQCWTQTQNMTLTFVYKTEDMSLLEQYGSLGYQVNNQAQLYYMTDAETSVRVSQDDDSVTIPSLFEKKLSQDYDGYTARYTITVNEAKAVLTDGSPLTIHDVMTDTLAYISGSLVITAEDAGGNTTTLRQGTDYSVTYDGTGNETDQSGKPVHVLDIVILQPQPVMYTLNYDTTLIIPQHVTGSVKYGNAASITLWGNTFTDEADEKVYADINIAAKRYAVEMLKTCANTGDPLSEAVFGLYNAQGGLISTGETDEGGKLEFETDITEGIILQAHVLYCLQEIQPPPGYRLDDTKYWFCFCDGKGDTCAQCSELMSDTEAVRIPFETMGLIRISNEPFGVELPATGGTGIWLYILCGLLLTLAPLVYGLGLRRRYERRLRE